MKLTRIKQLLNKLSGWHRIGVLISIAWVISVFSMLAILGRRTDFIECHRDEWNYCIEYVVWRELFAFLLLPVLIIWLIPAARIAVKWVVAGFKQNDLYK